jgi:hypothetical protein
MREFISLESLARQWQLDEQKIREAASAAGVMLFTLRGQTHADRNDLLRIGNALNREDFAAQDRA